MNYSSTTYQSNNLIINRVYIENGWIFTYNEKKIVTYPILIQNSTLETINNFFVGNSKEELLNIISELKFNEGINSETTLDKAIKEITNYTLLK